MSDLVDEVQLAHPPAAKYMAWDRIETRSATCLVNAAATIGEATRGVQGHHPTEPHNARSTLEYGRDLWHCCASRAGHRHATAPGSRRAAFRPLLDVMASATRTEVCWFMA